MSASWQALILAGGRSSRMGTDKARLDWDGRPLLDHLLDVLAGAGASSLIISGGQVDGRGVADRWPDRGPLGGLASALTQIDDGTLLVLPVDMPLLDAQVLRPLLDAAAAPALRYDHEPLPMRLQVTASVRATVEQLVQEGDERRSLNALFKRFGGIEIAPPPALRWRLFNCNTPGDWQRARAAAEATADADIEAILQRAPC